VNWDLPGNYVAPLTCFDGDLRVDYAAMQRQIDYAIEVCNPVALCIAGVENQEYAYLSDAERTELVQRCVELVAGRSPCVVGVSHPSFRRAIDLAHLARRLGAAAIQVMAPRRPFGGAPSSAETLRYFEAIARETDLPIVAYHHPGPGADLGISTLVDLTRVEGVAVLKESSRDLRHVGLLLQLVREASGIPIFVGMEMILAGLDLGAAGGAMPPPGAAIAAALVAAYRHGDRTKAAAMQQLLNLMPARWHSYGLVSVMKESMRAVGLDSGVVYPPYGVMSERDRASLHHFWDQLPADLLARVRPKVHSPQGRV